MPLGRLLGSCHCEKGVQGWAWLEMMHERVEVGIVDGTESGVPCEGCPCFRWKAGRPQSS